MKLYMLSALPGCFGGGRQFGSIRVRFALIEVSNKNGENYQEIVQIIEFIVQIRLQDVYLPML
jgi:hypothetical protein